MPNDIDSLRAHLFDTIADLRAGTLDVDRAKVIAEVAQVVINSAKVECDHMRIANTDGTGFIPSEPKNPRLPKQSGPRLIRGYASK